MNCAVDAGTYSAAFYGAVGSAAVCLGAFVNQPQDEIQGILVYLWALKKSFTLVIQTHLPTIPTTSRHYLALRHAGLFKHTAHLITQLLYIWCTIENAKLK